MRISVCNWQTDASAVARTIAAVTEVVRTMRAERIEQ